VRKLERQLGLSSVVAISVSTMLGSGLFVLPGLAAAKTGPSVWLAYLFAGLCVLPAALSKAELATAMPTSGGSYVFVDRAFGPLAGTIAGIGLWLSLLLKASFALVGFGWYLEVMVDVDADHIRGLALAALVPIVAINVLGVRAVSKVQSLVVAIAVATLLVLLVAGLGDYRGERTEPMFPEGAGGFLAASGFVVVSYAGVTKIAAVAEEVKQPERNLPLGMLLSLGGVMILYAAVTLLMVGVVPHVALHDDLHPIYTLAATIAGHGAGVVVAVVGIATMASMANGGLLAASRFPFAMSRDDLLPAMVRTLHRRYLTPVVAIAISGAVAATVIALFDVERIAKLASVFMIMLFVIENVVVIVLREAGAQWYQPRYRSPLYPWMQLFGIVAGTLLLVTMGLVAIAAGTAVALPGLVLFLVYGRPRAQRRGVVGLRGRRRELLRPISQEMPAVVDPSDGAAVVVALFGTERTPELLVEHGAALAGDRPVRVVHITEVPEQLALDALRGDPRLASTRRRIEAMAEHESIRLQFEAVVSRDVVRTVHDLCLQLGCEWLVMEWRGRTRNTFTVRNPLGWLKAHLNNNLAVFHDAGIRYIRKILVYAEPGPHDALVTHTADRLAAVHHADLTFVRYVPATTPRTRVQAEADYLDQVRELCDAPTEVLMVDGRTEAEALTRASADFDLLVMAEPPSTLVGQVFGGLQDRLTAGAACSVLRLQTPRSQTHKAVAATRAESSLPLLELLERGCVAARLERRKKDALFTHFAHSFADKVAGLTSERVVAALHERERTQNTAVGLGVALPHATVDEAARTYLGVFTTDRPVEYGAPDGEGVDVFFVTIGPPSERQTHLLLLAAISRLVLQTGLLYQLRKATSPDQIVTAVETSLAELASHD